MTNGRGFIALAAMIFGNWSPVGRAGRPRCFLASAQAFQINLQFFGLRPTRVGFLEEVADRRHAAVPLDDDCVDGHRRPHHRARRRWQPYEK